ncbi:MAG: hypothetical protein D3910_21395, partial [Candidatus Electrothrix sp. ATG2]|nr:hypothetical protein [Candidatus Electrothrix sp. ATG2]
MDFNIEWVTWPAKNHYINYEEVGKSIAISKFQITVSHDDRKITNALSLFPDQNDTNVAELDNNTAKITISNMQHPKVLFWELQNPDFQHSVYPALAAKNATAFAVAIANKSVTTETIGNYQLNPPFTPIIKKLTLDYNASVTLNDDKDEIAVFHIHPFGYAEVQPDKETESYPFLPRFDNAGELYIGLENFKPPQQLSVLFQMAEGTADTDLSPESVHWDYLSDNRWHSLENGNILCDGTRGLINTGVIKFSLPTSEPNTLLTPELYWLRASISKRPDSVCDTVGIHPQAVSATLVDNDNAPDHFGFPLAKDTIKKLVTPLPAVKAVQQPYTSLGGKAAEQDKWFYTRVSERLRHKQRALTRWDYEHLVLERFPGIYKVKCIPSSMRQTDNSLGTVDLIVIPDIREHLPADPFAPKASVNLLSDIQEYLQGMAPDSATVTVRNARYISFRIRMGVRFHQGV